MMTRLVLILAVLFFLTFFFVTLGQRVTQTSSSPDVVLLLSFDAARKDIFPRSCGGDIDDAILPNLGRFCRSARVYRRVYSAGTSTWPSLSSVYTGLTPAKHAVTYRHLYLSPGFTTLAELFHAHGYRTAVVSGNRGIFGHMTQLAQGFDIVDRSYPIPDQSLYPPGTNFNTVDRVVYSNPYTIASRGLLHIRSICPRCFVHLHFLPPHAPYRATPDVVHEVRNKTTPTLDLKPYTVTDSHGIMTINQRLIQNLRHFHRNHTLVMDAPPEKLQALKTMYLAGMAWGDRAFGDLLRNLRSQPWWKDAIVITTADHGEAFGEHGNWEHADSIYEEVIRVPLIIKWRDTGHAVRDEILSLVDLYSTLAIRLDPKRVPLPSESVPFIQCPGRCRKRVWIVTYGPYLAMARQGRYTIVFHQKNLVTELYDLAGDPGQAHDLAPYRPNLARHLLNIIRLDSIQSMDPTKPPRLALVSAPTAQDDLKALGYVGVKTRAVKIRFRLAPVRLDPTRVAYNLDIRTGPERSYRFRLTNTGRAGWPTTRDSKQRGPVVVQCTTGINGNAGVYSRSISKELFPGQSVVWTADRSLFHKPPRCNLVQIGFQVFPSRHQSRIPHPPGSP